MQQDRVTAVGRLTRRRFLRRGCLGAVALGCGGAGLELGRTLLSGPARVRFSAERAFVGDWIALQADLPGASPRAWLRVRSESGFAWTASVPLDLGRSVLPWRVPLAAVAGLGPGLHRVWLDARAERGPWHAAAIPLEIVVNRFAFGL